MLAKIDWNNPPCDPPAQPDYSGFPFWEVFQAEPNKERRICDFLEEKLKIVLYWPHFTASRMYRGRLRVPVLRAILPGVLFCPIDTITGRDRDRILDWVRLRPLQLGRYITKDEIEIIREIQGRLNARHSRDVATAPELEIGQRVRFRNDVYADKLGDASVTAIAPGGRISIKIDGKLFGGKRDMVVSAVELEAK